MKKTSVLFFAMVLLFVGAKSSLAVGEGFPNRPIKLVVAVAAGGGVDALARILAQELQNRLGQGVIVENRPGAGTTLGTRDVAVAEPDGYTLLVGSTNHVIAPVFFSNLGYDPLKSFVPVALVASWSHLLVVRPGLPVKTVGELVAYAKASPGKVTFGFGTGTPPQILGEYLKVVSGVDIASIPYRGSQEAITDMLGDRIDMNFSPVATLLPLIQQGKLRPLAYTGVKHVSQLPEVPTMIESGFPQLAFNPDNWVGIMAPVGTPSAIVATLNATINESLMSPELQAKFVQMGFDVHIESVEEFGKFFAAEAVKWPPIVKAAGIKSF
jgi:tripartite-type tricarboxylate transporter receptor subunit TctC